MDVVLIILLVAAGIIALTLILGSFFTVQHGGGRRDHALRQVPSRRRGRAELEACRSSIPWPAW